MRIYRHILPVTLIISLAACGTGDGETTTGSFADDDTTGLVNDAASFEAKMQKAYSDASQELREAARVKGDLACDLPSLPDARVAQNIDMKSATYNTDVAPEDVAAFYRLAAEAQGGSASFSGPPGMADVAIATADGGKCRAVVQGQLSGDTNVIISSQD